jgi:predicted neuraminidase
VDETNLRPTPRRLLMAAAIASWCLPTTVAPGDQPTDATAAVRPSAPVHRAELVFPLDPRHNHAPGIVECADGQLLVSWYRGSGERKADDVAVHGARLTPGADTWGEPFLMADTPGFPDCNTCLSIDRQGRLWLFWPVILDNRWESAVTHARRSSDHLGPGAPRWEWQEPIWLKPDDFALRGRALLEERWDELLAAAPGLREEAEEWKARLDDRLLQRLGWQPRCKPTTLSTGRIVLPLYSDTWSCSLMALSDDDGATWRAGEPLIGFGNIQPAVVERSDGTLVAYMRENGPLGRIRTAESVDGGHSWGAVGTLDVPNPGSGLDALRLASGSWLLVCNDTTSGRGSLVVALSDDEGKTWPHRRHLEGRGAETIAVGSYHYPAVTQGRDGTIHVVYSYFVPAGKSMKHVACNEAWIRAGDGP